MPGLIRISARYIVPVRPSRTILEHHSVIIDGDAIAAVLPTDQAARRFPEAQHIDLPHHVLLPGLINMHTHSPMTLLRGFADDLPLQVWLNDHIWPAEQRFVSPEFVADGTRLAIAEMFRAGTTCFNDNYFFPDVMADVVEQAGMRASIGLPIIELSTAWAGHVDEYLEKAVSLLQTSRNSLLVSFTLAPHAPYSVSDKTLVELAELSLEFQVPVHMHTLETAWDIEHSLEVHGIHPLKRLKKFQLLNDRLLAVHMTQLTLGDIRLLAESSVHVIHCPQSNLKLASGICPVNELLQAGINVAAGTDGAASNNDLDLLSEIQTAALMAKIQSGNAANLDAFTALEMLTINAAEALWMDNRMGSIEQGKWADLAALDLNVPETVPIYNLVSQLVYAASSRQFTDVWVAGKRVLSGGQLKTLDLPAIMESTASWQSKLAEFSR